MRTYESYRAPIRYGRMVTIRPGDRVIVDAGFEAFAATVISLGFIWAQPGLFIRVKAPWGGEQDFQSNMIVDHTRGA